MNDLLVNVLDRLLVNFELLGSTFEGIDPFDYRTECENAEFIEFLCVPPSARSIILFVFVLLLLTLLFEDDGVYCELDDDMIGYD